MAKFVYKMQGLLNVKLKLEEQEKISYGFARRQLSEAEEKLNELQKRKAEYTESKRQAMLYVIHARELERLEQAIRFLEDSIVQQQAVVAKAERILEAAGIRLNNAIKERKIQEKLREHALEEFKREVEAEEQKETNELVSFQYGNKMRGGNGDGKEEQQSG